MVARAIGVALACGLAAASPPLVDELAERRERLERDGRRPEGASALLGIEDLLGWLPTSDVREVVELGTARRNHPLVRALAEETLVRLDLRKGDPASAKSRRSRHGFVERWQILGPVGDGESLVRAEPPETTPFQREAIIPGKARPVTWRELPDIVTTGYIPLDAVLRPEQDGCAYAAAAVRSPGAVRAALRAGSAGPLRVWLGSDLVLDRQVQRAPRPDQDAAAVRLDRGWNLVRVKTCVRDGPWGFFLRFTDPAGRPLALRTSAAPADLAAARRGARADHRIATLREDLDRRARLGGDLARQDLAAFHRQIGPEDAAGKDAEREQRQAASERPVAENYLRLAAVSSDLDDRRRALEEAVRLAPSDSRALTALARTLVEMGRDVQVPEILERAVAAAPDHLPAHLAQVAWLRSAGFAVAATDRLRELEPKFPRASRLLEELADVESRSDRPAVAAALVERALREADNDPSYWRDLVAFRRAAGDMEGALLACDRLIAARPEQVAGLLEKAELLAGAARFVEASEVVRAALAIAPDEPRILERLGRLLHRGGRTDEAVLALSHSLELGPQNPDLRAYLARLRPRSASVLDRFRRLTGELRPSTGHVADPQASAIALWDLLAVEVHAGGQSRTLRQRIVEVRDDRGAREQAEFAIRYTPSRQQVDVRNARVHRGGRVAQIASRYEQELSEPWYGLFYDYRALVLRFDDLRPGDIVEIEYLVEDSTPHNLLGDTFSDLVFLQEAIPRREAEVVVVYPATRKLYFNEPSAPWLSLAIERQGDLRVHRVRMRDVPAVQDEPGMPGFSEVAVYLHVSTFASWAEVAAWYAALVRDQLRDDAAIREAVSRAVAGKPDERARVRAVHNLVVQKTRYVALEFGIHGYQPYRVTDVFQRKFGDCKDKAALLVVMMRLIGVEARMVLVRTRRGGDVADLPASLAIFDHAIAYLPKYDLYLDGTAEFSGTEELPSQDQGVPVLHVAPGEMLRRTPVFPAESSRVEVVLSGGLDGNGTARLRETLRLRGQAAAEWRRHYQSPAQRRDRYEQAWNERHAGARLLDVKMPSVEDLEAEVLVEADVQVPGLGHREGGALSVPVGAREGELVRTYARQSSRRHDLILDYPWTQESRIELSAPPGMRVGTLPRPQKIEGSFGTFELDVRQEGGRITSRVRLQVTDRRVPVERYAEFRRFLLAIDEALGQRITFRGE